jgi:hypothetical protein
MLCEILTSYPSDLQMEIASTDSMDFRVGLKEREMFLNGCCGTSRSRRGLRRGVGIVAPADDP